MRCASLLQGALSPPRSSCREELSMNPSRRSTDIHSLPIELLSWIFVLGSAFDYPYASSPFLLKPDAALVALPSYNFQVVAHVCKFWRVVALRTQSLWTTIHIRDNVHIPRAIEYLRRCSTSTCLFDILIDTVSVDDHTPGITLYKDELISIFETIIPLVHRWRTFHLKICDNDCKAIARKYLGNCGPGPRLETLQLYHFEDFRTTDRLFLATHKPPVTIFDNNLPCLKNVSLIGVNLPWDKSVYLTNLDHLELALHLDSVRPPYRWWDRMLRTSPELKSLNLHYSGPKKQKGSQTLAWFSTDNKIRLPKLRELSLTDLDPDYLCSLLERLQLPNLKTLTLDLREQDFTPFIDFLTTPPERLPPASASTELPIQYLGRLETLVIRGLDCGLRNWAALLCATRNLRVLDVAFAKTSSGFWKVFTHEGEALISPSVNDANQHTSTNTRRNPALFPRLEVFKLSGVSGKDIVSALYFRHRCLWQSTRPSETWTVRWSEHRRCMDPELDALVERGYWTPGDESSAVKVFINTFDDTEEDAEEADDETPSTSDEADDEEEDA